MMESRSRWFSDVSGLWLHLLAHLFTTFLCICVITLPQSVEIRDHTAQHQVTQRHIQIGNNGVSAFKIKHLSKLFSADHFKNTDKGTCYHLTVIFALMGQPKTTFYKKELIIFKQKVPHYSRAATNWSINRLVINY